MIEVRRLLLDRPEWGKDKGKLVGELTVEGVGFKTSFILTEEANAKILALVGEELVKYAQASSTLMAQDVLKMSGTKQIESNPDATTNNLT